MTPVVLDCSAVVPWFFPEEGGDSSRRLFAGLADGAVLGVAPTLLQVEFANVAWKKARQGLCSVRDAAGQFDRFLRLPIRYAGDAVLVKGSLALALECGITVYDACYLWLAVHGQMLLATGDDRLCKAALDVGVELYQ